MGESSRRKSFPRCFFHCYLPLIVVFSRCLYVLQVCVFIHVDSLDSNTNDTVYMSHITYSLLLLLLLLFLLLSLISIRETITKHKEKLLLLSLVSKYQPPGGHTDNIC